jgi:hypothetical protein
MNLITTRLLIVLLAFCVCSIGCQRASVDSHKIIVDFSESNDLFSSGIIESVQLIELETNEESLIGMPGRIIITENEIFILNIPNIGSSQMNILRFGIDGQFLNSIGHTGKGPGEFMGVNDFFVNKKTEQIELVCSHNQMLLFKVNGEYSGEIKNPNKIPVNSLIKTNDGNYFIYGGPNNGFDKHRIYLVDSEGEIIKKYLGQETNLSPIANENNFIQSGSEILFRESFNDTIYRLNNEGIVPYYIFDFGNYSLPKDIHLSTDFFSAINDCAMPVLLYENKDYILSAFFIFGSNLPLSFILKSKITGNTKLISMPEESEFVASFDGPGYLTDNNEIVFLLQPIDIKFNSTKLMKIPMMDELLTKILPVDENSNPFLVMAKIKEF